MTHKKTALWATLALLTTFTFAYAQRDGDRPSDGQRGPRDGERGPRGPREGDRPFGRGFGPPSNPVVEAIDADGNGEISAQELAGAVAALAKLDKNSDGVIDREEMRPNFGRPGGEGRGPRDGAVRPGDGDRPRGDGDRPRPDGDRPRGEGDRPAGNRPGGEGNRGPGGRGGFGGPEAFVDRMLENDADKDGKLSREELMKAAERFGGGGRGRGGPGGGGGGNRPERPTRPE